MQHIEAFCGRNARRVKGIGIVGVSGDAEIGTVAPQESIDPIEFKEREMRVELVQKMRERGGEKFAALLVKCRVGECVNVKIEEFEQFMPCGAALHGDEEAQQ